MAKQSTTCWKASRYQFNWLLHHQISSFASKLLNIQQATLLQFEKARVTSVPEHVVSTICNEFIFSLLIVLRTMRNVCRNLYSGASLVIHADQSAPQCSPQLLYVWFPWNSCIGAILPPTIDGTMSLTCAGGDAREGCVCEWSAWGGLVKWLRHSGNRV